MAITKINLLQMSPCLAAIVIDALGFGLVYPIMAALLSSPNCTLLPTGASAEMRHFYLGLGFMLYPLAMLFGTSLMGSLSDIYGRKKVLVVCMGGIAISFFLMALGVTSSSMFLLMLGRGLSGLMAGSQPIAQAAISDISTVETKAKNMSIIAFSYCLGSVLGPLMGGTTSDPTFISWFNFATPFYISSILSFIALAWIKLGFKETFLPQEKTTISISQPLKVFIAAFNHVAIRNLTIVFLLMQVGFSLYFQFLVLLMKINYHHTGWQLGAIQGLIGLGFAIGLLLGMPYLLKRQSVKSIAISMGILTGLGQILAAFPLTGNLQLILAILISAADIMAFTAMLTLFSNSVTQDKQGWAMGIANAAMALSWAITGLASNFLGILSVNNLLFSGGICLVFAGILLGKQRSSGQPAEDLSEPVSS